MNPAFTNCFLFLELGCSPSIVSQIWFPFTDPVHEQTMKLLLLMQESNSYRLHFRDGLYRTSFVRESKKSTVRVFFDYYGYGDTNITINIGDQFVSNSYLGTFSGGDGFVCERSGQNQSICTFHRFVTGLEWHCRRNPIK